MENLQGIQDQIEALPREEEERKERRRREEEEAGGDDMEDTVFVDEAGSSEEVGVRVEVGKEEEGCQATAFFREWGWFGKCKIGC